MPRVKLTGGIGCFPTGEALVRRGTRATDWIGDESAWPSLRGPARRGGLDGPRDRG